MSINPLTKDIQFGVASPAYQSRSAGTDFEDIILQIKSELEAAQMAYTQNLLSSASQSSKRKYPTTEEADLLPLSSLFKMDDTEFSLLDELLMTALEETRLAARQERTGTGEDSIESQVSDRYKMDISKLGKVLRHMGQT
ncbi:hypothetical protein LJC19_00080 [Oxalobacter sp. OttesenSCG-928-P03]|nr:hypothetical protein [Oxalobacter sp. OttesenSCG-928-P03]